jgi:hypothetical protein
MSFRVLSSLLSRGTLAGRPVVLLTGLALASACSSTSPAEPTPGSTPGPATSRFPATVTKVECNVHAAPQAPWVSLTFPPGMPANTYIFNVAPNPSPGTPRTTEILFQSPFRGESVQITQR